MDGGSHGSLGGRVRVCGILMLAREGRDACSALLSGKQNQFRKMTLLGNALLAADVLY
jgi:hypothetical protein